MQTTNENNNAFLIHISAFAGYVFPFGSVLLPLILWQSQKDKSTNLDKHGREAVNFNLSYYLYGFILGLILIPFTFGAFIKNFLRSGMVDNFDFNFDFSHIFGFIGFASVFSVLMAAKFILIIVAAIKASRGEIFNYPLVINFLK
ncbi:MAG: DUF4870 domain-containing protein [Zetaproteobacteria bacterium]|nr:DUF4870 domain-containing protein [Zetaproteobacteria bacterium]OIO10536.1 MAG: hypothetical protein AUJ53_06840 [Flavobacteriaceae bacterium CG1_02_35_72]PIR12458.1 MAG: hypothetical protein COV50_08910 [Flavobacteriales bacterium CG11_big_fil_rev_8_21_14_0_20_35_7]PJA05071.1 MAG: DUF4870 domain-containing protein [Flavobacteriales bacterium CG_4_10_14_0_2_um_filter_35_18]